MGSWNLTCAVTRTPIRYDDPIRVIFVGMNPNLNRYPGGRINITGAWAPLSLPIKMLYDDYGRGTLLDAYDWRARMFLNGLPNDYDMSAAEDLSRVFGEIRSDELTIPAQSFLATQITQTPPVGTMFMHESAYELLTRSYNDLDDTVAPDDLARSIRGYLEFLLRIESRHFIECATPDDPEHGIISTWFSGISETSSPRVFCIRKPSPVDILYEIHAHLRKGGALDDPFVQERIQATAEMIVLHENMNALSIPYGPTVNASDDYDAKLQSEICALATELSEAD